MLRPCRCLLPTSSCPFCEAHCPSLSNLHPSTPARKQPPPPPPPHTRTPADPSRLEIAGRSLPLPEKTFGAFNSLGAIAFAYSFSAVLLEVQVCFGAALRVLYRVCCVWACIVWCLCACTCLRCRRREWTAAAAADTQCPITIKPARVHQNDAQGGGRLLTYSPTHKHTRTHNQHTPNRTRSTSRRRPPKRCARR